MIDDIHYRWPEPHERQVVFEMLADHDSGHWHKCNELMRWLIMRQVNKLSVILPVYLIDDILQNAMMSVLINLPLFRFESRLTTWLMSIAYSRTIDALRLYTRNMRASAPLSHQMEGEESEVVAYEYEMSINLEEICTSSEELREVVAEVSTYINSHAKTERNRKIVQMVLFEGHTLVEAAREVGVSPAVASYVIRTLRQHLLEKFRPPISF